MDARALYDASFVWDDHAGIDMTPDAALAPLLEPWRVAGVGYLSVCIGYDARPWTETIKNIASFRCRANTEVPYLRFVGSVAEIDAAARDGMMAVTFDIEGMNALDGRVDMIQFYYDLGVRHMNFAYNLNNAAGSGCHDQDTGLTDFGRAIIDEMNRVGMVVDCTHTGYRTTMEAMERSTAPVIFSHSNPKALVDHGRNITDDQIRACAATGGVIGINGIGLFLGQKKATPKEMARHASYVADLVGPQHVGLCTDFAPEFEQEANDGFLFSTDYWPTDAGYGGSMTCVAPREVPQVVEELLATGFSPDDIPRILGGNFRRIAAQVWK